VARLFLAVRPPAEALAAVAELPRPDEPGVRWVPAEQWHITVRFLGDADPDDVIAAMPSITRLGPTPVTLGPRVSRLGRSVICLPASGLGHVASLVEALTRDLGRPPEDRPFQGHLTLARLRHRGACRLAGHHLTVLFEAREVELVASSLSDRGAQHDVIHRWPLAG